MPASLVVQTSFIGDVILTTPLIALLAERGAVDVVTTPVGASVLAGHPGVRRLMVYDKRGADRGVGGVWRTSRRVRQELPQQAYLAQGSTRSAALALLSGCRERVGFNTSDGRWLYTRQVEYRDDWHHARRLLALADVSHAASSTDAALCPRVYPSARDIAAVDTHWGTRERSVIALAPGSVWATKRWPHYADLARELVAHYDIALIGGRDDRASADAIIAAVKGAHGAEQCTEHVIDLVGQLPLLASADAIRRAAVLVTNDSSPQHLASAVGTPTVSIFGPTVPNFGFGPLTPGSVVVGLDTLACRPCHRHGLQACPLGHWTCMRGVDVATVYDAAQNVIQGSRTQ